jgi:hypothetical protein
MAARSYLGEPQSETALSGEGRADVHPPGIRVSSPGIGDYSDDVAATRAALSFLPSGQVDAPKSQNLRPIVSAIYGLELCEVSDELREVLEPRRAFGQVPLEPAQRRLLAPPGYAHA